MRQLIRRVCVWAGLSCALWQAGARAEAPGVVAIQDARIVTVSGAVLEKGTVVVRDGIIAEVGAAVAVPKGAWVVDGKGLTVYPGLIDALSTWGIPEAAAVAPAAAGARGGAAPAAMAGQTAAPRSWGPQDRPGTTSWVKAADLVKTTDRRLETARGAGFTTAVTFPKAGLVAGHGAVVNLGGETSGQMVVDAGAGLYMTMTPVGYSGYPSSPMGMLAYFRQLWIDAEHYKLAKALYAQSPASVKRPEYDRALEGVLEARRVLLPAASATAMERMLKLASDLKTPFVLYGVVQGYEMAERLKQTGTPVVLNVKWPARERDADPERVETLRTLEIRDKAPTSPAALAAAGVKFAVSSDGMDAPRDVIRALKKSIDVGLKKEDALKALTLHAAEIYGLAAKMGSVEKGKIANLVVTDGDLFDDKTKVKMVFVDGVKYLPPVEAPQTGPGGLGGRPTMPGEEN
jgi:imidazolonepropionase-like amidohydrolase